MLLIIVMRSLLLKVVLFLTGIPHCILRFCQLFQSVRDADIITDVDLCVLTVIIAADILLIHDTM